MLINNVNNGARLVPCGAPLLAVIFEIYAPEIQRIGIYY